MNVTTLGDAIGQVPALQNDDLTNQQAKQHHEEANGYLTPIHYIIIVLMFYMGGLTVLIIKYVQSENEEARYEQYYVEYVKRSKFNRPHLMKQIRSPTEDQQNNVAISTRLTENASFFHLPSDDREEAIPLNTERRNRESSMKNGRSTVFVHSDFYKSNCNAAAGNTDLKECSIKRNLESTCKVTAIDLKVLGTDQYKYCNCRDCMLTCGSDVTSFTVQPPRRGAKRPDSIPLNTINLPDGNGVTSEYQNSWDDYQFTPEAVNALANAKTSHV
ncbi:uncharacterized protein LOC100179545 [Ciona intestinalis]